MSICTSTWVKDVCTVAMTDAQISNLQRIESFLGVKKPTDLQVLREVVEQNDLQQKLLSSDDVRRHVQGQEEILEHCELQEGHMGTH